MSVEVRDGRILWVGSASDWAGNRTNIRVVDGRARTLIPGLMDCHVHYSSPGGPDWIARFIDSFTKIAIRGVEFTEESLKSGIKPARDVGLFSRCTHTSCPHRDILLEPFAKISWHSQDELT